MIAFLCTLSKDFFHYGFFNGGEEVVEPLGKRLEAMEWRI
ncbi:MAG: hypothetical protein OJF51_000914 [Nitrospira sp.]|nr:MAG: hypothetical protein OJF51_000914 [Nitrospira sp.]